MQYAFNVIVDRAECSVTELNGVRFSQNKKEYDRIAVYSNGEEFEYLLSINEVSNRREVVITDGFCTLDDFTTRRDISTTNIYHVCPIAMREDDEITATDGLVSSLNEGIATIIAVAVGDEHQDLVSSINQFKEEIFDTRESENSDVSTENKDLLIDIEDMINYLDNQNESKRYN